MKSKFSPHLLVAALVLALGAVPELEADRDILKRTACVCAPPLMQIS